MPIQKTARPRSRLPHALLLGLLAPAASAVFAQAPASTVAPAAPAAAQRDFQVSAGPLSRALTSLALQAGVSLTFDPTLVNGLNSPGVLGRYSLPEAFRQALAGSGLEAVARVEGGYTLRALPRLQVQEVTTLTAINVSGHDDAAYTTPGSVHRLRAEQLERVPVTSPADVFRGIPGLTVANSRNGPSIDVNIRGMQGQGRVKVLVDGTQSSSSSHRGYAGSQDQTYIDPDLLSSITVEKGPNSGPYGAGAVGGVVNLQTLQADDLLRDGRNVGVRLRGSLGTNGDGPTRQDAVGAPLPGNNRSGSLAAAWRPNEQLEFVAAHARRASGNYIAGHRGDATYTRESDGKEYPLSPNLRPGDEINNSSQENRSTLLKARVQLPHQQSMEFNINDYHSFYGEFRSTLFDYQLAQQPLSETKKRTYAVRYGWNPDTPWLDLKVNLWKADLQEVRSINAPTTSDTNTRGLEAWNTSRIPFAWADLKLTAGASFFKEDNRVMDYSAGTSYREAPDGKRDMWSAFAQAESLISNWLAVDAGLRYDRYSLQGDGLAMSTIPGQSAIPFDIDRAKGHLSPSFGITASPIPNVQGFVRYSEGWRPPSIKESLLTYSRGRTLLDPETARSLEIGANLMADNLLVRHDRLRAKLAWFNNRHDNYIVGATGSFRNIDGARFRGTELALEYDAGWVFAEIALTRYSRIAYCGIPAGSSCQDSLPDNVAIGGQDSMGIYSPPRWTRQATVGVRLLERKLVLGARINAAGERGLRTTYPPGQGASRSNWAPYETYDLFGHYAVSKALNVAFSIENLRDRYYLDTSSSLIAIPSPGRTARVTLTYQF